MLEFATLALYSLLLGCVLIVGSPYWLWRAARAGKGWTSGLMARLGRVPRALREAVRGRQVVWVQAVSVGEVLAATRLVAELERTLGDGWSIVVSTTTATGQALARQRFAANKDVGGTKDAGRVFYYPLDFAWAVRAYLRALRPEMLVLMESELWPRMLAECRRAGIPVAVVNARVSDRSFARGMRVRSIWRRLLRRVGLFLAQSEEDARRLMELGASAETVHAVGNLKYDAPEPKGSEIADRLKEMATGRRLIVAGSTLEGEEQMVLAAWPAILASTAESILVLAPRHPERFQQVHKLITESGYVAVLASQLKDGDKRLAGGAIVLLDTIGDLAAVYGIADAAFVGGSLVRRGGHNPLEPARFGVPVVMGPSYENFRDIVGRMRAADGVAIVADEFELQERVLSLLSNPDKAKAMGARGRQVFEQQQGATGRTVDALMELMRKNSNGANGVAAVAETER